MRKFTQHEDEDSPLREFPTIKRNTARRLYPSVSHEIYMFVQYRIGKDGNLSQYIEKMIKADPQYKVWRDTHTYGEQEE